MSSQADSGIARFWEWFANVAGRLGEERWPDELVSEMDLRVRDLGPFSWEMGPGIKRQWQLVISPAGDPELVERSAAIVAAAPSIEGWEFYGSKQPRQAALKYSIIDHREMRREVDAQEWRYLLLQYVEGPLDIVVQAPELADMPPNFQRMAVEICLDGLIGEEARLRLFDEIEVCDHLDGRSKGKGVRMADMPAHLRSMGLL